MSGLMEKARKSNTAGYSVFLTLELAQEWAPANPKGGKKSGCVVLDQGCPLKYTGQYECKCGAAYWGNDDKIEIVMARLQRVKPRSWKSGWWDQTCDASDHAQDF